MDMRKLLVLALISASVAACATMTAADDDPNLWLEDVHGERALAWVKAENGRSLARLEGDKRYASYERDALKIFTAKDRIALPEFRAGGVDNLWQDEKHPHGIWRHAKLPTYQAGRPTWRTLIDLDALSKADGKNWFLKGTNCLAPDDRFCLVSLSDGGGDAIEIREFDTVKRQFVAEGFHSARAKQGFDWIDQDTVIVARALGDADATESGYPYVLRILKRGQGLEAAHEVFRGTRTDTSVSSRVLRDAAGQVAAILAERRVGFFDAEFYLLGGETPVRLPLPTATSLRGLVDGQLIFTFQSKWHTYGVGALVAIDLASVLKDPNSAAAASHLIVQPSASQTIDAVQLTRDHVVVQMLDDVKGAIDIFGRQKGEWTVRRLALPENSSLIVRAAQRSGSLLFVTSESFLEPTRMWSVDVAGQQQAKLVAALPAKFRSSSHRVEQHWAVSKDGTKIPYFLVVPQAMKSNGGTPTLMYGYGGFQLSKPPVYLPEMGKLWLERGGAFVIANIRGGGEFGPAWHQSALREHRQRAFDDFAAVGEDLIATKITSPRRLGIYGRSNGGVLTTVSMTQRPDLFNAVVVESPLVDMLRYHKLSAGASWVAEYGNPDVAGDRDFISEYSAYQKLKSGVKYPEPYITTNTEDDRVHPGHARKYAARLSELGAPYLYFENTFGGHSNDADPAINAKRWARHYVYLAQKLMD